jgi:hypothetical protein
MNPATVTATGTVTIQNSVKPATHCQVKARVGLPVVHESVIAHVTWTITLSCTTGKPTLKCISAITPAVWRQRTRQTWTAHQLPRVTALQVRTS